MRARSPALMALVFALLLDTAAQAGDAPEISKSRGRPGSILVLWPRVVPGTERARSLTQAAALQERLRALVRRVFPNSEPEVRPRPERVCPNGGGCKSVSVGALLVRRQEGCAVVALISGPGESAARLVPWAGDITTKRDYADFREPPESQITIEDFARCDALGQALTSRDQLVEKALRFAFIGAEGKVGLPEKR